MIFTTSIVAALLGQALAKPFEICSGKNCKDCKVTIDDLGTGYPNCVIYESKNVFSNQGFEDAPGGTRAYLSVGEPNDGCAIIVKSPANTDVVGCGFPLATTKHAACLPLILKETFMIQYCCGHDNCHDAGAQRRSARFSPNYDAYMLRRNDGGVHGGVHLKDADGNTIKPLEIGVPQVVGDVSSGAAEKRDGGRCNNDWDGTPVYTKPSDETKILVHGIASSATRTLQVSQSWTNGTDFSLGVADILSLGATFSKSFTEGKTESTSQSIEVPEGETGDWGWTATMECTKGHGTCDGKKVEGEICWPALDDEGHLIGQNHLIIH